MDILFALGVGITFAVVVIWLPFRLIEWAIVTAKTKGAERARLRGREYAENLLAGHYDKDVQQLYRIDKNVTLRDRINYLEEKISESRSFSHYGDFDRGCEEVLRAQRGTDDEYATATTETVNA